MARLTITVASGSDSAGFAATQELATIFEAALAVLVADAASPTQAHVTTANNAYTNLKAVWTNNLVVDYDRAVMTTPDLIKRAVNAALQQAVSVS